MTYALLLLSAIMAVAVWWLVRQTLGTTPWVEGHPIENVRDDGALTLPPVKVGLWVFLAVATSLFGLLISAYHMRMMGQDWTRLPLPPVLWLNTGVLVLASVAMHRARGATHAGRIDRVRAALNAAGVLSFAFLAGQLWAWRELDAAGYFSAANPAYAFFYVLTAVHGLHLLGGLVVWGRTTVKVWRGAGADAVRLSVELCAVYWHFLLAVWIVLLAVLLHTHA